MSKRSDPHSVWLIEHHGDVHSLARGNWLLCVERDRLNPGLRWKALIYNIVGSERKSVGIYPSLEAAKRACRVESDALLKSK